MKYIIDTDPGHDDFFAILYAIRRLDVVGLTTVFGNSTVDNTTQNALRICDLAQSDVPVAIGAGKPIVGDFVVSAIHGNDGLQGGKSIPQTERKADPRSAVEFLIEMGRAHAGSLSLIVLGPMTNIALALRIEPKLADWISEISFMGGATATGNVAAFAEANVWKDPEAAQMVLSSGIPLRMAGLNLTNQARLSQTQVDQLANAGTKIGQHASEILAFYLKQHSARYTHPDGPMHDPCAVISLVHPELFKFRDTAVSVELASPQLRGMTICDMREIAPFPGEVLPEPNVKVGVQLDGPACVDAMIEAILEYR
ncbi:ribonucleoside hydrolase [Marinomonas ushuaiensis DSM 15871]|uniref:Ribonucleoside hydrolase n=1 Tax=Marinomonas ushuaiensis DSM 15871 TaxID=1122207 RepID=X7E9K4_9GAMM|nr:nucleoside hydrolase [Marinomonas ushuaiensis]ETX11866.1 ribonucleoside hydrolase [Marinomonas ushuaiensis DSM 15871]